MSCLWYCLWRREYYPFVPIASGMQTANSWTRDTATKNNFLSNGGTELNTTSQLYDLEYRNYEPALGRMNGVDPMANKYSSLTPYNYSFNNPVMFNDPSGADLAFVGVARQVKRVDSPTNKMNMECPAPAFPFAAESRLGLHVYSSLN